MQENQGTVMATKANNVDGYEVPFQKDVGKLLGKFGLAWPDLLLIITLLETAWWITFGFLDGADVTLRTTFDYNDQLYPVYMLVKRTVCLARLAGVIWCVWYSCIIQGKPAPLGFYIVSSLLLDSCIIAWDLVQIYCYDVKSSLFNITYGCYFTIAFYFTRVFVYWMVGCCVVEIFREDGSKSRVDKLAFIGKGWGEIARFYKLQEERAALLALAFDVLWATCLFILHQLPIIMFQTTYVGIFGLSPEIQICLGSVMHPNVSFIFGVMGIVAFKCKSRGLVFGWIFVTIFYIVLSVLNLITFVVIAFGMEGFNNVVPVFLGLFTMYFDLRVSVCYLVLRGYRRLGEAPTIQVHALV